MKIIGLCIILMIVGSILVTGCVLKPTNNETIAKTLSPTSVPPANGKTTTAIQTAVPVLREITEGTTYGQLNVSVGNYNAILPVFVDNMSAGQVSAGKMLNLKIVEGTHSVKVCSGEVCERVGVEIRSGIKTTVDFEERLKKNAPQGSLSIGIGNYPTSLPAFIDDINVGMVLPGKVMNQTLGAGKHNVKICVDNTCFTETVEIKPSTLTGISFEKQLKNEVPQGSLSVYISGYDAELPVLVDNITVGVVSMDKSLDIKVNQGNHTVKVCVGKVCVSEDIQIKFAKQSTLDFGERLKKEAEFPTPTVRIIKSTSSGNTITVDVEFINPDKIDHSMTATILCVYSVIDSQNARKSDSARRSITNTIKAGDRVTQQITLSLTGGSNAIVESAPVVVDVTVK